MAIDKLLATTIMIPLVFLLRVFIFLSLVLIEKILQKDCMAWFEIYLYHGQGHDWTLCKLHSWNLVTDSFPKEIVGTLFPEWGQMPGRQNNSCLPFPCFLRWSLQVFPRYTCSLPGQSLTPGATKARERAARMYSQTDCSLAQEAFKIQISSREEFCVYWNSKVIFPVCMSVLFRLQSLKPKIVSYFCWQIFDNK